VNESAGIMMMRQAGIGARAGASKCCDIDVKTLTPGACSAFLGRDWPSDLDRFFEYEEGTTQCTNECTPCACMPTFSLPGESDTGEEIA
jgi:hypothetical protein